MQPATRISRRLRAVGPLLGPHGPLVGPSALLQQCRRHLSSQNPPSAPTSPPEPADHRKIGLHQELYANSPYSPGSPIFLPAGARIFNRLVDLLRAQYVRHGFDEVITPTMYKTSLWKLSGHLENYAAHMYSVHAGVRDEAILRWRPRNAPLAGQHDDNRFSLKPMNCPGHCLVFAARTRGYRELPLRLADFGALHRNEVAGALTGLTRVRRFHQDDGHIFCRPSQVHDEIARELTLVRDVYRALQLEYRLALSTRPEDGKMLGSSADWDLAEGALRDALEAQAARGGAAWTVNAGDGAFYGPKIDVVVRDRTGKEHQTATIQLDFQLPMRFGLRYDAPAPELEAQGLLDEASAEEHARHGDVTPVLIHRAVLGSVERMMALLMEHHADGWPFWLNPRQIAIVAVNQKPAVAEWARHVREVFLGIASAGETTTTLVQRPTGLAVEYDDSATSVGLKIRKARSGGVGAVCVIGDKEAEKKVVRFEDRDWRPEELLEVFMRMMYSYAAEWDEGVKSGRNK